MILICTSARLAARGNTERTVQEQTDRPESQRRRGLEVCIHVCLNSREGLGFYTLGWWWGPGCNKH